jgi:hypothetical protein
MSLNRDLTSEQAKSDAKQQELNSINSTVITMMTLMKRCGNFSASDSAPSKIVQTSVQRTYQPFTHEDLKKFPAELQNESHLTAINTIFARLERCRLFAGEHAARNYKRFVLLAVCPEAIPKMLNATTADYLTGRGDSQAFYDLLLKYPGVLDRYSASATSCSTTSCSADHGTPACSCTRSSLRR